ncbi:hypothetical protein ACQ4PT_013105 [Festuca glaucescens]
MKTEALMSFTASGVIPQKGATRWRMPGNEEIPLPEKGEFVVFVSFLERGLSFPTSQFLRRLLSYYNIQISDLGPHSIQQISLFVALCEGYLGCPPYFPLWLAIFHGRVARENKKGPLVAVGGITFQVKASESFIDFELPKKAQADWRKFWFYMKEETPAGEDPMRQFSSKRSKPRNLCVNNIQSDQKPIVKAMRAYLIELTAKGLTAINLYNCWMARRLAPLRTRRHLMCEYRGHTDSMWTSSLKWTEVEYAKAIKKITTATFSSFNEGLQPYTQAKPAPMIWRKVDGLAPLLDDNAEESPKMEEKDGDGGEEEETEEAEEDNDEATNLNVEQEPAGRTHGQKRPTATSSQSAPEEKSEKEEGEIASSPKKRKKSPSQIAEEKKMKRTRQTTILDSHVALECPMSEVLKVPVTRSKPKTLKKASAGRESVAERAAKATEDANKNMPTDDADGKGAAEEEATKTTSMEAAAAKGAKAEQAKGEVISRERRSKSAADRSSAKDSSKPTDAGAATNKQQPPTASAAPSSHDVVILDPDSEVATSGRAVVHPLPSMVFEKQADELTRTRDGYLPTKEVHAKIKELEDQGKKTYAAWESAKADAAELQEIVEAKEKELEEVPETKNKELELE